MGVAFKFFLAYSPTGMTEAAADPHVRNNLIGLLTHRTIIKQRLAHQQNGAMLLCLGIGENTGGKDKLGSTRMGNHSDSHASLPQRDAALLTRPGMKCGFDTRAIPVCSQWLNDIPT